MTQVTPPGLGYGETVPPPPPQAGAGKATASMILGICSLFIWLCPLVGLPVSIVGLVLGLQANARQRNGMALAGIIMSIIGLILAAGNFAWGAYLGATGQHPLLNEWTQ